MRLHLQEGDHIKEAQEYQTWTAPNKLGKGQFGYVFDVRQGKEDEAEELREEWKNKEVKEDIPPRDKSSSLSDIKTDDYSDDSQDDDAFLSKYNEDGNFIG